MFYWAARRGFTFCDSSGVIHWRGRLDGHDVIIQSAEKAPTRRSYRSADQAFNALLDLRNKQIAQGGKECVPRGGPRKSYDQTANKQLAKLLNGRRPPAEKKVLRLLDDADPNDLSTGFPLVCMCVRHGFKRSLSVLAERGADLDQPCTAKSADWWLYGPAGLALRFGHRDIVDQLLELGASLEWVFASCLHEAARQLAWGRREQRDSRIEQVKAQLLPTLEKLALRGATDAGGRYALLCDRLEGISPQQRIAPLKTAQARQRAGWANSVQAQIKPLDSGLTDEFRAICDVIAEGTEHARWADLVVALINASPTYAEVFEATHGETFDPNKDEDQGLLEAWADGLYTSLDRVAQLLARPPAVTHPRWEDLVGTLLDTAERIDYHPVDVAMLREQASRRERPIAAELTERLRVWPPDAR